MTAGQRPNILFLNVDQLSCDSIGHHGCTHVKTPNLDRLARRSVSFTQSYSVNPVCAPARSGWFTGRLSVETGVYSNGKEMVDGMPTLGKWLQQSGYQTFHSGKSHLGHSVLGGFRLLGSDPKNTASLGDIVTTRSVEGFLRNYRDGDPFFFAVGLLNPHDICSFILTNSIYKSEPPFPELAGQLPPLPANFHFAMREPEMMVLRRKKLFGEAGGRDEEFHMGQWKEDFWRYYLWAYYRYIEMVDGQVGLILDALENSPFANNTLVILSSDHGDGHTCHQLALKSFLYDEAARVPMLISLPGHLPENIIDSKHLVSGADLFPTICDYAGAKTPSHLRGYSLRGAAEGKAATWRDFVVAHTDDLCGKMLRTNDYKLIAYRDDSTVQLFDMKKDPWETRNLAESSQYAAVVKEHQDALSQYEAGLEVAASVKAAYAKPRNANARRRRINVGTRGGDEFPAWRAQ